TVGETYVMRGILMDKATGEPLLVDGKEVVALTTFTPEESSGSVEVTFTFDSTALAGKTLVVFESLEYEGATIAEHRDLSDKGQTVVVEKPGGGSPQTGRDGLPIWMLILSIAALAGCVTLILYIRKKNKQDHVNK
ncbi:MAG: VaFE repeat-containing surface-anchored protein, partial [Firmicutes bacterium]|nr:VaFE repeat-containing surface-anchored protein [Bacillota bacterium]